MARTPLYLVVSAFAAVSGPAVGQMSAPPIGSELPHVNAMSAANTAGVLQYCAKHGLVSTVSADAVVHRLEQTRELKLSSSDYLAGQAGHVLPGAGKPYMIKNAAGHLQSRVCDMVLKRAKQF